MFLVVQVILDLPGVDQNATAADGFLPGSTPPLLYAASRGYFKVVELFKCYYK